jgi:hypothetical protein
VLKKRKQNVQQNLNEQDKFLERCPICKSEINDNVVFCPTCGRNINRSRQIAQSKQTKKNKKLQIEEAKRVLGEKAVVSSCDLTGIEYMFKSGVAQSTDGRFSRSFEFSDISYVGERQDVQDEIFEHMCALHSSLPPKSSYQINLINAPRWQNNIERWLDEVGADKNYAHAYNEILMQRQREGRTEIVKSNYFTLSIAADSAEEAESSLAASIESVKGHFAAVSSKTTDLDGMDRLHVLHNLLRGGEEPFLFDYASSTRSKEAIAPSWAGYNPKDFLKQQLVMPCGVVKSYHVRDFGASLSDNGFRTIRALPIPMNISLLWRPQVTSKMIKRIGENINIAEAGILDYQRQVSKSGGDFTMVPPALERKAEGMREMQDFVLEQSQTVGYFQGIITLYADSEEQMKNYATALLEAASTWSIDLIEMPCEQEQALTAALPLATTSLNKRFRSLASAESAIIIPFSNQNIHDNPKTSYLLGQDRISNQSILIDPGNLKSPHMWIFGMTGSGKGMLMNSLLTYLLLQYPRTVYDSNGCQMSPDPHAPQIFIADMHGEYCALAEAFGGTITQFGAGYDNRLNLLGLGSNTDVLTKSFVAESLDHFLAITQDVMNRPLTQREKSMIDRCTRNVFEPHFGKSTRPILGDLYSELKEQDDEVATELALGFEMYVEGTMNALNGTTNVADKQFNVYDFSELGSTMQTITLLSCLQHIKQCTYNNNLLGRKTIFVLEEAQVLFDNEPAVKILASMYAELRKFGLQMISITQLPDKVLDHPRADSLFKNTGLFALLAQTEEVQDICTEVFKLSKSQRSRLSQTSEPGSGLIIAEGVKIPMKNTIPKENPLYQLWSTDPETFAAQRLAREKNKQYQKDARAVGKTDREIALELEVLELKDKIARQQKIIDEFQA